MTTTVMCWKNMSQGYLEEGAQYCRREVLGGYLDCGAVHHSMAIRCSALMSGAARGSLPVHKTTNALHTSEEGQLWTNAMS